MNVLKTNPSFIRDAYRKKILRHDRREILQDLPENTISKIKRDF
jgi:hypothetical protein